MVLSERIYIYIYTVCIANRPKIIKNPMAFSMFLAFLSCFFHSFMARERWSAVASCAWSRPAARWFRWWLGVLLWLFWNSHLRNEKCQIKYMFFPLKYPYNSEKWEKQSYVSIKIIKLKIVGAQHVGFDLKNGDAESDRFKPKIAQKKYPRLTDDFTIFHPDFGTPVDSVDMWTFFHTQLCDISALVAGPSAPTM